jgi:hypothetical protein
MTLDRSNFNINPYYDDFDEAKKFLQVLFKPGYSVQARELTQVQSILSNQIGRMADHIFENGDVIQGGGITERNVVWFRLSNVAETDSATTSINSLIGYDLYYDHTVLSTNANGTDSEEGSNTKVVGKVVHALESTSGDPYKIIFVELTKDNKDESVAFPRNQGSIKCSNPNIDVTLKVADLPEATTAESGYYSRGEAILINIEEGLFYVDGYFVMNDAQTIAVSEEINDIRYFFPTERTVSVGFSINRDIISASTDNTLRDPSQGSYNYNAPGGDRFAINLKIKQIAYIFDELGYRTDKDTQNYFEWARIIKGETFKKLKYPEYAQLEETLARRTYDESGHYTVRPFSWGPEEYQDVWNPADTQDQNGDEYWNYYAAGIETGKAYVKGYEFELQNTEHLVSPRARTTKKVNDATVQIDFGNYVLVEHNMDGVEPLFGSNGAMVDNNMNLVGGQAEPEWKKVNLSFVGANGEQIAFGCARIIQIMLHSTNQGDLGVGSLYRVYLNSIITGTKAGFPGSDLMTIKDATYLSDPQTGKMLFKLYKAAGQEYNAGVLDRSETKLIFQVPQGEAVKRITGLDYSVHRDFELNFSKSGSNWEATVTAPNNSAFQAGSLGVIDEITNTSQYLVSVDGYLFDMNTASTGAFGGNSIEVTSSDFRTLKFTLNSTKTTEWTGSSKQGYMVTNIDINADDEVVGSPATTIRKKILKRKTVTITNSTNADSSTSMWNNYLARGYGINLGYPDVVRVEKVQEIGTGIDLTDKFDMWDGQTNYLYDHAYIHMKTATPGGTFGIDNKYTENGSGFKVTFLYYDHKIHGAEEDNDYSNLKYPVVVNSYVHGDHEVVDFENGDGATAMNGVTAGHYLMANKTYAPPPIDIQTYGMVPTFTDKKAGIGIKLTDCIDFRPIKVGKWDESHPEFNTIRGAWTPADGKLFYCDYEHYLGRADKMVLTRNREFKIIQGLPSVEPQLPLHDEQNEMEIFHINVPPFTNNAMAITAKVVDNKRFTMSDIGSIEERVDALEKTTDLDNDEQDVKNEASALATQSLENGGSEEFLNVFSVDGFNDIAGSQTDSREYNVSINPESGEVRPGTSRCNLNLVEHTKKALPDGLTQSSDNLYYITPSSTGVSTVNNLTGNTAIYPNPFSKTNWMGNLKISPSTDDWFAMEKVSTKVSSVETYNKTVVVPQRYYGHRWYGNGYWGNRYAWNYGYGRRRYGCGGNAWGYGGNWRGRYDHWRGHYGGYHNRCWNAGIGGYVCKCTKTVKAKRTVWKTIVKDVKMRVRPKLLTLTATFMKPNTRYWAFIDGKRCTENSQSNNGYVIAGSSTMRTDGIGSASIQVQIPKDNPYSEGELLVRLTDNKDNIASLSTTTAEDFFVIGGVNKDATASSIRTVRAKRDSVKQERIVQDASTLGEGQLLTGVADYFDPMAQVFEIDQEKYGDGVYATSVDLFFRDVDGDAVGADTVGEPLPFAVELRPLMNGLPHPTTVLPFSFTSIGGNAGMTGSKNGPNSSEHTRFEFSSPVYLASGRYALICKTNSKAYSLWGTQMGSKGLSADGSSTESDVERQPYMGSLFQPQNNGSRIEQKNKNIMFRLNRATFPVGTTYQLELEGVTEGCQNQVGTDVESPDFHEVVLLASDAKTPDCKVDYYINPTGQPPQQITAYEELILDNRDTLETADGQNSTDRSIMHVIMSTDKTDVTPLIDMDRLSMVLGKYEQNQDTSNELLPDPPVDEDNAVSRYISNVINCGQEANVVRVSFEATRQTGTDFKVYAKCGVAADETISDNPYVELTGELSNVQTPATTGSTAYKQKFYYRKPNGFTDFQIKIVLTGDPTKSDYSTISKLKTFAMYDATIDTTIGGAGDVYAAGEGATEAEGGDNG